MGYHRLEFKTTDKDDVGFSFHEKLTEALGEVDILWSSTDNKLTVEWFDEDLKTEKDPASVIREEVGKYIIEEIKL